MWRGSRPDPPERPDAFDGGPGSRAGGGRPGRTTGIGSRVLRVAAERAARTPSPPRGDRPPAAGFPRSARLPGSGDADPRRLRRPRPAPRKRAGRRRFPPYLAGVPDEAAARRGERAGLPDRQGVPRRRERPPPRGGVHHRRVVPPGAAGGPAAGDGPAPLTCSARRRRRSRPTGRRSSGRSGSIRSRLPTATSGAPPARRGVRTAARPIGRPIRRPIGRGRWTTSSPAGSSRACRARRRCS